MFILDDNNRIYLIDGAHRVHFRSFRGLKWIKGYCLVSEALEQIHTTAWQLTADGTRKEMSMTEAALAGLA